MGPGKRRWSSAPCSRTLPEPKSRSRSLWLPVLGTRSSSALHPPPGFVASHMGTDTETRTRMHTQTPRCAHTEMHPRARMRTLPLCPVSGLVCSVPLATTHGEVVFHLWAWKASPGQTSSFLPEGHCLWELLRGRRAPELQGRTLGGEGNPVAFWLSHCAWREQ